ncbi:MAG: sulfur carrier protein ThiS [Sedimentisphaerales bacterium]|nr:sulfur carrier protein ThiS [Sedimentisphaerales bacterium]MBN2842088.1 sulfur carrier protein ThiS [Sedimentisphaerales bacterium]
MTEIMLNGQARQVRDNISIKELLSELAVTGPVAVELNRRVCPKALHGETMIKSGDVIEIVTIVGGG